MSADLAKPATKWLAAIAAAGFVVLVFASTVRPYGWFIDELYYLACARHLAFGYVDHPPLSIAILAVVQGIAGPSLIVVRGVAAAAFAACIVLTGLLARELGGSGRAQCLAAIAIGTGGAYLAIASFFSMNVFEILAWIAMALVLARTLREDDPRRFRLLGVIAGFALLNKHTSGTLLFAIFVALVATRERKVLATRWPWIAAAIALAIVLPNLVWQWQHGFVSLEFYRAAQAAKNVPTPMLKAIGDQVKLVGPLGFLLAMTGATALVRARDWRRVLGFTFVILFLLMVTSGSSRPDRIAGAYPIVFAAGAVVVDRKWLAPISAGLLVVSGTVFACVALPLLSPPAATAYAERLGIVPRMEKKSGVGLPQWLADRLGWEAFATQVGDTIAALPGDERAHAIVLAPDYGHAGALELFGPAHGVGRVISDHNAYWFWSRDVVDAPVLVAVDVSEQRLRRLYDDVQVVGTFHCDGCMPSRNDLPILVARRPRVSLGSAWASMKHFE